MDLSFLRLEWDLNPRVAVLQTAALDRFAIEPLAGELQTLSGNYLNFNRYYLNCKPESAFRRLKSRDFPGLKAAAAAIMTALSVVYW